MPLLYHAYVYLEFLILACTIYILASGSNLSEEDFHYLWGMRKVCSRVEKMSEFIDEFILKESIYGINASRNVVI